MDDKSKKIKKMIIIMIIVLIIILLIIIIGVLKLVRKVDKELITDEIESVGENTINNTLEKVTIRNNYYIVKNIIENYYSSLCNLNKTSEDILILNYEGKVEGLEEVAVEEIEINKNKIYSFFDDNYINEMELSIDNIQEKLGNYNDLYILINDMYVREISETLKVYLVYGKLTEKDSYKTEDFSLMMAVDSNNSTFNIYTSDYIEAHNLYELSKTEDFKEKYFNIESIENRKYNKYNFEVIDDETYTKDLLKTYTQSIKYNNIDYSYNRLDEEYRINKFKEKSYYEEYIAENKKNITIATLDYYKIQKYQDYKQYICVDKKGNYYIFNETSIMDYTLILDTYTVDFPEFVEKYTNATDQTKVRLNIEKIVEAINQGDYRYIYSKLDNTFKQNNFPIENDLKRYMKNNFLETNSLEYLEFSQEGNIYIYKTKINEKYFNIIMQLGDGTEFTMSFSFS